MRTPLFDALLPLLSPWQELFCQQRTFFRAMRLALAQELAPGCRTISRIIAACKLEQQDRNADYRMFSRIHWQQRNLFKATPEKNLRSRPPDKESRLWWAKLEAAKKGFVLLPRR